MNIFKRYAKLYLKYIIQYLKSVLEYRADFLVQIFASFIVQICGLLTIWGIFNQIQEINGWTYWEIVVLYATMNLAIGFGELLFEGPWGIYDLCMKGGLDYLLVRPAPVLFQIFASTLGVNGFGNISIAILIFSQASWNLRSQITPLSTVMFVIIFLLALPIKGAIILASTSICFWTNAPSNAFPNLIHNMAEYTKYPITIYPHFVQCIFSLVIPYAFVSFYPVSLLLSKDVYGIIAIGAPAISIISILISVHLFKKGLNKYESVGS